MAFTVKDVDKGYERLKERLVKAGQNEVYVGIDENAGAQIHHDDVTVFKVALWTEFGNGKNSPARSYIRGWYEENSNQVEAWILEEMPAYVRGEITRDRLLAIVGAKIVKSVKDRMSRGIPPPNAEATIRKKGSATPTIESATLRDNISFKIQRAHK